MLLLVCSSAWATHTALVGGLRDGMALGIRAEKDFDQYLSFRYGFAATTGTDLSLGGDNPFLFYGGFDRYLFAVNQYPISFGLGAVAYTGLSSQVGPYFNVIVDNLGADKKMFLSVGVDFIDRGYLQLQVGYKYWSIFSPEDNTY